MVRKWSLIAFFTLLVLYAIFQGRYIIFGPNVRVESPQNDSTVDHGVIIVKGVAKNISKLTLDDREIFTDTKGIFEEKLIASPGINIIKLEAKDRFGREKEILTRVFAR